MGYGYGFYGAQAAAVTGGGGSVNAISASNGFIQAATITFGNSNGVSFMVSAGSIVASFSQSFQPVGSFGVSNLGNTSGNTGTVANQMILAGGNNITLSQATNTDGITVTISAPNQTNQTLGLYAASNTTQNSSTILDARSLTIQGAGIISAGYSNGSIIISATGDGVGAALKGSGVYTQNTGTIEFANSNGVTFGLSNNGVMTASVLAQSSVDQNVSLYGLGNTTQNSSTVLSLNALSFNAIGSLTVGYSNGSIQFSAPNALTTAMASNAGSDFVAATAAFAGTNASGTIASNGISVSVAAQSVQPQNASLYGLGNTTQNSSTVLSLNALSFNAIGDITVGYSNGSIQFSASQSTVPQNISFFALGNTTQNSSTFLTVNKVSFNGLGGMTVGYSNGSIQLSAPVAVTTLGLLSAIRYSAGTTSLLASNFTFADSNGVTFGLSPTNSAFTASVVTSYNQRIVLSDIGNSVSASNPSRLAFADSYGVTLSLSTGALNLNTLLASHNGITSQSNQDISLYALGNTTQNSSTVLNASNLSFNAIGSLTVGYSNGSIQFSAPNALTTAMASNRGSDFVQATAAFAGTNASGTIASDGISVSVNAQSVVPQNASLYGLGNTTQNSSTVLSLNALSFNAIGSLTVGYSNGSIQFSAPNALTTARASTDAIGLNTAATNVTWTVNSNGISLNAGGYAGTGTSATNASITLDSNGLAISVNAGGAGVIATQVYNVGSAGSTGTVTRYAPEDHVHAGVVRLHAGSNTGNTLGDTVGQFGDWVLAASGAVTMSGSTGGAGTHTAWISVAAQSVVPQNASLYALGNTTQNSSTVLSLNALSFNAIGSLTIGYSNGSIQFSAPNALTTAMASNRGSDFVQATAAFAGTNASGTIASDGISVSVNAGGAALKGSGTYTQNTGTIEFANSNNITFGLSNNGTMTASINPNLIATVGGINATFNNNAIRFLNLNGISWGLSNGLSITASHNGITSQSNQDISLYALGNTTQNSSTVLNASNLSFNAIGSLTVGYSNGSIQFSAPNALTTAMASNRGSDFVQATAAFAGTNASGTIASNGISVSVNAQSSVDQNVSLYGLGNTTQNSSTVLSLNALSFNGLGGMTVGYSNGSIQLSGVSTKPQSFYALGNTTNNSSTTFASAYSFAGLGGITVGYSNGSIQLSGAGTKQQSYYAVGNTTQNSSTDFGNFYSLNAIGSLTIGYSNGSIQFSAPNALTTARASTDAIGLNTAATNVTWTVNSSGISLNAAGYAGTNTTFNGANVSGSITLNSNGLNLSLSAATAAPSPVNVSAGTTSNNLATIQFGDANGVSFGLNGSTITASHNGITSQSNQTIGLYALGSTTQNSSTTLDARTLSFNGLGGIVVGYSNGSIQISLAPRSLDIWENMPYGNTVSGGAGSIVITGAHRSLMVAPLGGAIDRGNFFPADMTGNTVFMNVSISGSAATNSSAFSSSFFLGIYTLNGSTLSLLNSGSFTMGTNAGNANLSNINHGQRFVPMVSSAWSSKPVFKQGSEYWIAYFWSSAGVLNQTGNILGYFMYSSLQRSGSLGVSQTTATSMGWNPYYGVYSVTTAGFPNSILPSELNKVAGNLGGFRPHIIINQEATASF